MEERFDIVNEHDEVIGSAPRSEVHQRQLNHRAVHIWVYRPDGKILIQLRTPTKDRHPNTWDSSAAGHVDSGEDYLTAAVRETKEELGIDVHSQLEERLYVNACEQTGQEFVKLYRTIHPGPFEPCPKEIADLQWIHPDDLEKWMSSEPEKFAPALPYLWHYQKDS
ncbi:MAG: NUDIX domain-containing protein [Verrucomicrobiota bacterium]